MLLSGCAIAADVDTSSQASPVRETSASAFPPEHDSAPEKNIVGEMSARAAEAPPVLPCPDDMAQVETVCVDRYEAHLVEVDSRANVIAIHPYFERPKEGHVYAAVNQPNVFPQGYISRTEAAASCQVSGKRLCTIAEWQRACRNRGVEIYPYGDKRDPAACNVGKQHLLTLMYGGSVWGLQYDKHFNNPLLNQEPGFLAKTGAFAGCVSDLGIHDMVGNLHEWVSDNVNRELIMKLEGDGIKRQWQPIQSGNAVFMGGFYSTAGEHGPGCLFTTGAHEASYHDYSTGFRCCRDAANER